MWVRHISIERFVHVLLFCFAFASTGTISDFMTANEHGFLTSWGLAVALGFGLVAVSMMLAGASMEDAETFRGILAGVIVVACMSATVQTMAYHEHANNWLVASVLGVGFPLVECVLAFGVALHDASEKRKRVLHVRDDIQRRISESVGDAMADIDLSQVRSHIEQRVDAIIRQQVDIVVDSMGLVQSVNVVNSSDNLSLTTDNNAVDKVDTPVDNETIDAPEVDSDNPEETIYNFATWQIQQNGKVNQSEIARLTGFSRPTVKKYVNGLAKVR